MYSEISDTRRGRFRRVSKARIFAGHPLKTGVYAVTVMVITYISITAIISLLFTYFHGGDYYLEPANPNYTPIKVDQNVSIVGKVISVVRRF